MPSSLRKDTNVLSLGERLRIARLLVGWRQDFNTIGRLFEPGSDGSRAMFLDELHGDRIFSNQNDDSNRSRVLATEKLDTVPDGVWLDTVPMGLKSERMQGWRISASCGVNRDPTI